MTTTDDVLKQRGAIYGDFFEGITCEAQLLSILENRYRQQYNERMPRHYYLYFSKIAMKLSRLSISPDHIDSWTDIAGYARLVEIQLTKESTSNAKSTEVTNAPVATYAHKPQVWEKAWSDPIHESAERDRRTDSTCPDCG